MIKDELAKLDEIIDDCIIALTRYTQGEHKITSYDEVVIDRPKLVSKTAQLLLEARIEELKWITKNTELIDVVWGRSKKPAFVIRGAKIDDRIAELKALGTNQ